MFFLAVVAQLRITKGKSSEAKSVMSIGYPNKARWRSEQIRTAPTRDSCS